MFVVSGHVGERVEVGAEVVGVVAAAVEEFAELEEVFADAGADPMEVVEVEGGRFGDGEIGVLKDPGGAVGEVHGVFGFDSDLVLAGLQFEGKGSAKKDVEGDFFALRVEDVEAELVVEDDLAGPTGEVFGFLAVVTAAPAVEAFAVTGEGGGVFEGELEDFLPSVAWASSWDWSTFLNCQSVARVAASSKESMRVVEGTRRAFLVSMEPSRKRLWVSKRERSSAEAAGARIRRARKIMRRCGIIAPWMAVSLTMHDS